MGEDTFEPTLLKLVRIKSRENSYFGIAPVSITRTSPARLPHSIRIISVNIIKFVEPTAILLLLRFLKRIVGRREVGKEDHFIKNQS